MPLQITLVNLTSSPLSLTCHNFKPAPPCSKWADGSLRDQDFFLNPATSQTSRWASSRRKLSLRLAQDALMAASPSDTTGTTADLGNAGFAKSGTLFSRLFSSSPSVLATASSATVHDNNARLSQAWSTKPEALRIKLTLSSGAAYRACKVPYDCPWMVFANKVAKKHHNVVIMSRRNMESFLSTLPNRLPLSSLCLPGTHDTMAHRGWPFSQCQSAPLDVQLRQGIRVLDVRLAIVKGTLIAYHGVIPQHVSFATILSIIHAFFTSPLSARETLIMSIKQEDHATKSATEFSQLVRKEIMESAGGLDMWFLKNRVPTLGEVRGKVVMFSRFGVRGEDWAGGLEGMGIHPTTWPNSIRDGFSWTCKETTVRVQDWYDIPSFIAIPEKVAKATAALLPLVPSSTSPNLSISFFSASSFPLGLPPAIAHGVGWPTIGLGFEGVNGRTVRWLLAQLSGVGAGAGVEPRIRGWAMLDFFDDERGLVPLLVECNFRGRKAGEEGW